MITDTFRAWYAYLIAFKHWFSGCLSRITITACRSNHTIPLCVKQCNGSAYSTEQWALASICRIHVKKTRGICCWHLSRYMKTANNLMQKFSFVANQQIVILSLTWWWRCSLFILTLNHLIVYNNDFQPFAIKG